jgi:hypothetical protein
MARGRKIWSRSNTVITTEKNIALHIEKAQNRQRSDLWQAPGAIIADDGHRQCRSAGLRESGESRHSLPMCGRGADDHSENQINGRTPRCKRKSVRIFRISNLDRLAPRTVRLRKSGTAERFAQAAYFQLDATSILISGTPSQDLRFDWLEVQLRDCLRQREWRRSG